MFICQELHAVGNRVQTPPSKDNKLTFQMFFYEFSTLLEHLAVEDPSDSDAAKLLDMLSLAGLNQRVAGPTHKHGHTLDLVIVPQGDSIVCGSPELSVFLIP